MITALAVDDEPLALEVIKNYCSRVDFIELKGVFTETAKALQYLKEQPVDLLLLDINMPAVTGIDFYKLVPGNPMVIFTTAFREFAVEGFDLNAVDYLLKPIEFSRFQKAAEKALDFFEYQKAKGAGDPTYFYVRVDYSMVKVMFEDIKYIEGLDNYIKIHFINGRPILVRMSMKLATEKLPEKSFVRVHRSYIVAVPQVTAVKPKSVFLDDVELPIGANYADQVGRLLV